MADCDNTTRECRKCGLKKKIKAFPLHSGRKPTHECKICCQERQAAWLRAKRKREAAIPIPDNAAELLWAQRDRIMERIMDQVDINRRTGCWEWRSAKDNLKRVHMKRGHGYPRFAVKLGGKWFNFTAHRVVSAMFHGLPLEDGSVLSCHKCDNVACVNEAHLFNGSNQDNQIDAILKRAAGDSWLTINEVRQIKRRICEGAGISDLARKVGVTPGTISNIKHGRTWGFA